MSNKEAASGHQSTSLLIISSPSLLESTVKHHLESTGTPVTEQTIHDIYVDNVISVVNTMDNVIQCYKEIKQSFKEALKNMRDWGSNSTDILKIVPADDCNQQVISKVLGILWNNKQDNLMIRSPNHETLMNAKAKWEVLPVITSVYDLLGYLSPAMTKMKVFLQKLWEEGKDWDHKMTSDQSKKWIKLCSNLDGITEIALPRYVGNENC